MPGGGVARRPLHFIVMADCSGSMKGEKMQALNYALRSMLPHLVAWERDQLQAELLVRILGFATVPQWHVAEPLPVADLIASWQNLAYVHQGRTNMGAAFREVGRVLGPDKLERRALRPAILLITDGLPTDPAGGFEAGLADADQLGGGPCLAARGGGHRARRQLRAAQPVPQPGRAHPGGRQHRRDRGPAGGRLDRGFPHVRGGGRPGGAGPDPHAAARGPGTRAPSTTRSCDRHGREGPGAGPGPARLLAGPHRDRARRRAPRGGGAQPGRGRDLPDRAVWRGGGGRGRARAQPPFPQRPRRAAGGDGGLPRRA